MNTTTHKSQSNRSKRGSLFFVLLLIAFTPLLVSCNGHTNATDTNNGNSNATQPSTQLVEINNLKFEMELALTARQRQQGLSDRASIADNGGMLFVFPKPESVGFVMRRCLVPIDIAFVKEDGTVAAMYEMKVENYDSDDGDLTSYPSHQPVLFALEFKAGTLAKTGLKRGDKITLPVAELKSRAK